MAVPSYARATTTSTLRASPRGAKTQDVATPNQPRSIPISTGSPTAARRLKRPSTLTSRDRESIAYKADLHHIKASSPSKPCPLAALPSELRCLIYSHVLGDLHRPILMNYRRVRHSPSTLLQICRAIRIEAAYMYYTSTAFTWTIKNLNFTTITKWLSNLHPSHRALLSRNKNLAIEIVVGLQKSYTYPPKDFFLDDTIQNHWKACQPFGNLYAIKQDHFRTYFILFCRLASWFKLCSQAVYTNVRWDYVFDMPQDRYSISELNESLRIHHYSFNRFLRHQLQYHWMRNRCVHQIKQPVLDMTASFIDAYQQMDNSVDTSGSIVNGLKSTEKLIEIWSDDWEQH